MKIAIDCDDAAVNLKKVLFDHLKSKGIDINYLEYSKSK
jgi:ribose 5-phosphate isomerase RpiB